jgi:aminoglycoside phosphotransferase (APT) family kinase protein
MRQGEELDAERVHAWLTAQLPGLRGRPAITQYSGGVSNWTYRLEYESHDLVLRRGPAGTKAKGAHDMGREYRLQKALAPVYRSFLISIAMLRATARCDPADNNRI